MAERLSINQNRIKSRKCNGMRQKIIKQGVKNLREYGYPSCNEENILTDMIYSKFFLIILRDNLESAPDSAKDVIAELIKEIEKA